MWNGVLEIRFRTAFYNDVPKRLSQTPFPNAFPKRLPQTPFPNAFPKRLPETPFPNAFPKRLSQTTFKAMTVDLLAIMAHPDDAELLCGGTLARAVDQGHTVGILDLTAGESGSFGDRGTRAKEAEQAARVLGVHMRRTAGLPDAALENTVTARNAVAAIIRELKPRTVILHWPDARHPDHRAASEIGRDACFVAGIGGHHRPSKVLYALTYQETSIKPTFVVDVTQQMSRKLDAIVAFGSQFDEKVSMGDVMGSETRPLREQILAHHAHYGSLIRKDYGEPFWTKETVLVDDIVSLSVRSL